MESIHAYQRLILMTTEERDDLDYLIMMWSVRDRDYEMWSTLDYFQSLD
jgi:hypothetical protein